MLSQSTLLRTAAFVSALTLSLGLAPWARADNFFDFPDDRRDDVAAAIANVPGSAGVVYDASGDPSMIQVWDSGTQIYVGPIDITSTLNRIRMGYWIRTTTMHDGGLFNLRPGELPSVPDMGRNYYREFFVWPFMDLAAGTYDRSQLLYGSANFPGSMRILIGQAGEVYFTGDHYGQQSPPPGLDAYFVNPTGPSEPPATRDWCLPAPENEPLGQAWCAAQ